MRTENPRTAILFVLLVIGTVCLLGLAGFAFSGSPNTPSAACISNLNGPSQPQYHDLLQALVKNLEFIAMTQGRCFGFISGYEVTGPQGRNTYLVFDHYTPHVVYYCNYFAAHQVDERLQASPVYSSDGSLVGFDVTSIAAPSGPHSCPAHIPWVYPVTLQAQNDSVETVSISLRNHGPELTRLNAILILPSDNYTATFATVSESNPVPTGSLVSQSISMPLGAMRTWTAYIMVENCSFLDGTTSSWIVSVELEG